jgi:hypothetical protein
MGKQTRSLNTRKHRSSVSYVKSPYTRTQTTIKHTRNKPRRTTTYKLKIKSIPKLKHSQSIKMKKSHDLDDFRDSPPLHTNKMTPAKLTPSKSKRVKQDFLDDFGSDSGSH